MIDNLEQFIEEWRDRPLIYGQYDCAQMVSAWVKLATGKNPLARWKKYDSLIGGIKTFKDKGFDSFSDAVTSKLTPLYNNYFAKEGDIVAIKSNDASIFALGIFISAHSHMMFLADNDEYGTIIPNSEKVRIMDASDFMTGLAWSVSNA